MKKRIVIAVVSLFFIISIIIGVVIFKNSENNIKLASLMARKYFCNMSECIKLMLPPGTGSKKLDKRTKEKTGNFVFLAKDVEEISDDISSGKIKSEKQKRILEFLFENDGIYSPDLEVLTDTSLSIFKTLEKNGYIEIVEKQIERNPFINKRIERDEPKKLTEEQEKCFNGISFCIENDEFCKTLIYGITGSGKTEVYFEKEKYDEAVSYYSDSKNFDFLSTSCCSILGALINIL